MEILDNDFVQWFKDYFSTELYKDIADGKIEIEPYLFDKQIYVHDVYDQHKKVIWDLLFENRTRFKDSNGTLIWLAMQPRSCYVNTEWGLKKFIIQQASQIAAQLLLLTKSS